MNFPNILFDTQIDSNSNIVDKGVADSFIKLQTIQLMSVIIHEIEIRIHFHENLISIKEQAFFLFDCFSECLSKRL